VGILGGWAMLPIADTVAHITPKAGYISNAWFDVFSLSAMQVPSSAAQNDVEKRNLLAKGDRTTRIAPMLGDIAVYQ
jgi:hypothetical protein